METIEIQWSRYPNFFELCRQHRKDTQLIYVIGDQHHCYIGSIGSQEGKKGLGTRYQWQYVHRSRAIFGLDEDKCQVSYAGKFQQPVPLEGRQITAAEAMVQDAFVRACGRENALFDPEYFDRGYSVINLGVVPPFLR